MPCKDTVKQSVTSPMNSEIKIWTWVCNQHAVFPNILLPSRTCYILTVTIMLALYSNTVHWKNLTGEVSSKP